MIDFSLRMGVFFSVLTLLLVWQALALRSPLPKWRQRWWHNGLLLVIGALCVRLFQPVLFAIIAALSPQNFFLDFLAWPFWTTLLIGVLLLDCLIYWQHRLFHQVPLLWRLHRVHHTDTELDTSSAVRFHPVEIILSLIIKASVIWLLGIPFEVVIVFDILLNASAMFNHTNVRLPSRLETGLKKIFVTPDMHRIHHSRINAEANSNYGFCLSIWDRLFASYTHQAQGGDAAINLGLPGTKNYQVNSFKALFLLPFKNFKRD